jgi:hypothetical protein
VIVVLNADEVFADEPAGLPVLVKVLNQAAKEWNEPVAAGESWDRPAVAFHVVLQPSAGDIGSVRKMWAAAGADVENLAP